MTKVQNIVPLTLRLPRSVRDSLKKIAEKDRRSLNDQIIYALERWLEAQPGR